MRGSVRAGEGTGMNEREKVVQMDFTNECGTMKLTIKGERATEIALEVGEAFREACDREEGREG